MNSAQRLLELIDFFSTTAPDKSIQEVWARYIDSEATNANEDDVLEYVRIALAETRLIERLLGEIGVPGQLFQPCTNQLREALSPRFLNANWRSQNGSNIQNASVRVILQWASWTLGRFNENPIDPEAWNAVSQALEAHEKLLNDTADIPPGIRAMLERQVRELRQAMAMYKLQGVAPIQAAVNHAVGELRTAHPELVSALESSPAPVKSLFQQGRDLVGQAAELSDKGSKIAKFTKEIYQLGSTAWTVGKQLFSLT